MAKSKGKKAQTKKTPAHKLLLDFMNEKGLSFYIKKQKVRFLDDNGIVIDPPEIVVFYKNQAVADDKGESNG